MSDKWMGFIFLFLETILIGGGTLFVYQLVGGLLPTFFMFVLLYLFTGFCIWIACLPDSGSFKEFLKLLSGWYPVLIYKIYWEN